MKTSTNRAVEAFLLITFPVVLFAGCAIEGGKKPEVDNRQTMQEVPAKVAIENDLDSNSANLIISKLQSDTQFGQSESRQLDDEINESNSTPDMPTVDQLSGEAVTISWVNEIVDMPIDASKAIASSKESDDLVKVNIKQMDTDHTNPIIKPDLDNINFAVNASEFDEAYLAALQAHAEFLNDNPALTLTVSGHTDSSGSVEYNRKLSKYRAMNVYYVLLAYGAPEAQLIMDAYGEASPLNHESNLQENRRVELEYSDSLVLSAR